MWADSSAAVPRAAASWKTVVNGSCCRPLTAYCSCTLTVLAHQLGHVAGARVAVAVGVAEQLAVTVQQAVVHGPGVDADPVQLPGARHLGDTGEHLAVDAEHVPEERAADRDAAVGEAVHLLQGEVPRTDAGGHHTAARRPEVDGREAQGRHRRKAAATPASTGMCSPVVWLSWSVQRTKTALAMLSGSTSRLRIVRCA